MSSVSAQINTSNNPTADDELSRLQQDYIERLPEKIEQITDLWNKLQYVNWNDHAFAVLHRLAHGIAGSGKSFGFAKLSQEAKKLENYIFQFLDTHNQPDAKERKHIDALIDSLLACAKNSSTGDDKPDISQSAVDFKTQHSNKVIYVVDDDPHVSQYLSTVLSNVGYQVRIFANPKMACEYINHLPPDLVILDIMFPQGNLVGIDFVEDIRASAGHRVPIFFISSRTDLKARVNAVRSGGDAYLTKPLDDELLLEKIEDTLASQEQPNCRILIVDDDVNLSQYYKLALKKAGFNAHVVNKPVRVIEELEQFNPDLVLLDMYMPEFDGMELASVIRQDDKYIGLPIIFVSAEA
ncbi:response regulator, partial [Kaarinaea lacus]